MEDLIVIGNESFDLGVLQDTIMLKVEQLDNIVIDPNRITVIEEVRTSNNDLIKSYENRVKEALDFVTASYRERLQPILDSLEPLKKANKEFADKILETKKMVFKETVRQEWINLGLVGDGELPPFEDCYDERWYGKARKVWLPLLAARINKLNQQNDTHLFCIKVRCDYKDLGEFENLLISKGNYYEIKVED